MPGSETFSGNPQQDYKNFFNQERPTFVHKFEVSNQGQTIEDMWNYLATQNNPDTGKPFIETGLSDDKKREIVGGDKGSD